MQPTIPLVPYAPEWNRLFEEERAQLAAALGGDVLALEHIGSTAIPAMLAKPIIDIGIAVTTFEQGARCIARIESLGYEYRGEYGIPRRHYFVKGNPRTHHLHLLEESSQEWQNHLLFRDFLRRHPALAVQYAQRKKELALSCGGDRSAYTQRKAPFIEAVLRQAKAELESA